MMIQGIPARNVSLCKHHLEMTMWYKTTLALCAGLSFSTVLAQLPFPCVDTAYLFQDEPITGMYSLSLGSGDYVVSSTAIVDPGAHRQINGLGYNPQDNFIYGCLNNTASVIRIHGDLTYDLFTVIGLPSTGPFNVGDVDDAGRLYLYGGGSTTIYVVDVSQSIPTLLSTLPTTATSIADWAYSPFDGFLYGLDVDHDFWRFNTTSGARDSIGHVVSDSMQTTGSLGAAYLDLDGDLYVQDNLSGYVFKIQRPDLYGASNTSFFSVGPASAWNDGAYCRGSRVAATSELDDATTSVQAIPNPTSGRFKLKFREHELNGSLIVRDIQGRPVHTMDFMQGVAEQHIDISRLGAGVYLLDVEWLGSRIVIRLVKE